MKIQAAARRAHKIPGDICWFAQKNCAFMTTAFTPDYLSFWRVSYEMINDLVTPQDYPAAIN
jgi:hypothetical protein